MPQTRIVGTIKKYGKKGFGFIDAEGVSYFFHQNYVKPWEPIKLGMRVEFDVKEVEGKSAHARNIKVLA